MKSGGANYGQRPSRIGWPRRPSLKASSLNRLADRRLVLPSLISCGLAVVLPLLVAFTLSFTHVREDGSFQFATLEGYQALFAGGRVGELLKILIRALATTCVTMLISMPAAYWIAQIRLGAVRTVFLTLLITPWLVSDMLRSFGWQLILAPDGPISKTFSFLTNHDLDDLRYRFSAVVIGLVSAMIPAGTLSVLAALPNRNRNEWLAAAEIGSKWDLFRIMLLGRARGGIVLGTGIVFTLSFFATAEARFLDGPTQTSIQTIAASLVNIGVPALLAFGTTLLILVVLCCVLTATIFGLVIRAGTNQSMRTSPWPDQGFRTGGSFFSRWHLVLRALGTWTTRFSPCLCGVQALLLSCAPIFAVGVEAFRQPSSSGWQWTLENFHLMLASHDLMQASTNSIWVAAAVASLVAFFAFVFSLVVWERRFRSLVFCLCILLIVLPGDVYSICLIQCIRFFDHAQGGWSLVVISHFLWALPFGVGTLLLANRHINENVLRSSLEYSRSPLSVVCRLVARINIGRIFGVAVLAGTLSLNEFVRTSYLGGGLITIGNLVHGRLTAGLLPENRGIFAVELLLLVVSVVAVVVVLAGLRLPDRNSNAI